VVLVLIFVGLVGYMVYASYGMDGPPPGPPPTEEELLQARLDIHRIERGFDLKLARQDSRRAAAETKRAIADALDDQR
jgi:hypothetical protein